jgi:multicomponent Na+:H+ antiporter subunit E
MAVSVPDSWRVLWTRGRLPVLLSVLLWAVLTEGAPASWTFGLPVAIGCGIFAARLLPMAPFRLDLRGTIAFVPFFLRRSLVGGVDVARRALAPDPGLEPSVVIYRMRLPADSPARVVFLNVLSLLPGTLAAGLDGDAVTVHVLSGRADDNLQALETAVARMFRPAPEGPAADA